MAQPAATRTRAAKTSIATVQMSRGKETKRTFVYTAEDAPVTQLYISKAALGDTRESGADAPETVTITITAG